MIEHGLGEEAFVSANDDPVGTDAMRGKFFDNRVQLLRRRDDGYAAHGAANQVALVVEDGDDPSLNGRVGAEEFDVKRRQTVGADDDDMLGREVLGALAGSLLVMIPEHDHGPRGQQPGRKKQKLQNGGRARDAFEAG